MRRGLGLLLCGAAVAGGLGDLEARLVASVEATLARYPPVGKSTEAVARFLAGSLWGSLPAAGALVYDGKLVVDRRFLRLEKNRKHANLVASFLAHEALPNAAYVFSGNSTGECGIDDGRRPCLVIAKARGHGQRGLLTPNPSPAASPAAAPKGRPPPPPGTSRTWTTGRWCGSTCGRARRRGRSPAGTRASSGGATSSTGGTHRACRAAARRARTSSGTTRASRR